MAYQNRPGFAVSVYAIVSQYDYAGDTMCFFFHKWGKWRRYIIVSQLFQKQERQYRICFKCGKKQDVLIKEI